MTNTDQELVALAPGAGHGVGKMIAAELLGRDGIIKRIADAFERGLGATRRTWDSGAKCWVEEPDTRSQLQAAFGILAHMEGEPIKRIIHEIKKSGIDPLEALDSPAAVQAAERMVAGARAKLRRKGVGMKAAEVVDVDA